MLAFFIFLVIAKVVLSKSLTTHHTECVRHAIVVSLCRLRLLDNSILPLPLTLAKSFNASSHCERVRISIICSLGSGTINHWFVRLRKRVCSWVLLWLQLALELHAKVLLGLSSNRFLSLLIRWQIPKVLYICQHVIIRSVYDRYWLFWRFRSGSLILCCILSADMISFRSF